MVVEMAAMKYAAITAHQVLQLVMHYRHTVGLRGVHMKVDLLQPLAAGRSQTQTMSYQKPLHQHWRAR
jgi:hypothetical protein